MHQSPTVAIIGAGIAGIACAKTLHDKKINVKVFDKGRGIGGRMATRRVPPWQWDHGAQYLTAEDAEFQSLLDPLPTWSAASPSLWKVGEPAQNQLVKHLSQGIEVALQTQVTKLARGNGEGKDEGWTVDADTVSSNVRYDAVAMAVPAPQARELLPRSPAFADLERVRINPCWALMIATPEVLDVRAALASPHEHIAWLATDHSKPRRPQSGGQYVLHATAAWSERHLECANHEVEESLLAYFQEIVGPVEISYIAAHRWRFALTQMPLQRSYLIDPINRIGACGDWCLGARVEHGYLSGTALGNRIADLLAG